MKQRPLTILPPKPAMSNSIVTMHKLDFEVAPWQSMLGVDQNFVRFRIGTCEGLWQSTPTSYDILAITNESPGNGHFDDVLQWFEHSCKRDGKDLRFLEIMNQRFFTHLLNKRHFKRSGQNAIQKLKWMK